VKRSGDDGKAPQYKHTIILSTLIPQKPVAKAQAKGLLWTFNRKQHKTDGFQTVFKKKKPRLESQQ